MGAPTLTLDFFHSFSELVFQKPSISVNSSEVVTQGESVSIDCKSEGFQNAEFTLQKANQYLGTYQTVETKMGETQFRIVDIQIPDAGIYRCRYCLKSDESAFYQRCSNYSDSVYLNITGEHLSYSFYGLKVPLNCKVILG